MTIAEEVDEFLSYLETPKSTRTASSRRRRTTGQSAVASQTRLGKLPQAYSVRVTPRGHAQTSWWKAQRVAEATLVVRKDPSIVRRFDAERASRIREEATGRYYQVKPGAAEEEKHLAILQKIYGGFVKDSQYI